MQELLPKYNYDPESGLLTDLNVNKRVVLFIIRPF